MPLRTVLLLVLLLAVALFAALNWSAFLAPTTLSLGVTEVQAPLGLILLGLIAFITALFLAYLVYLQTTVLMESRRHAKELQVQRELADQAEASRFTELRAHLDSRLTEMENSLSAELGEMRGSAQGSMRGSGQDSAQDFLPGPMRDSMGGPTPDRPDR
jgi:predicted deacetylase